MNKIKKEKLSKDIEAAIYQWIMAKQYFEWYDSINYMCYDISHTFQCSKHLIKKIFFKLYLTNKEFQKFLSNFTI